jgi:hypothetical protein
MSFLRFVMLLSLAVWIGALIFFPVVAQTSFSVLPSTHLAGLVVRDSLVKLHWMVFVCGFLFLASSLVYNRMLIGRAHVFGLGHMGLNHVLIISMLALTAFSQFRIIPRMDTLPISAMEIATHPSDDPIRQQFDSLHAWSTRIEETVLVLGLIVLYSTSRRICSSHA